MVFYLGVRTLRLRIPAKKASPAPPVGPTLGQEGINIIEFCKEFNEKTKIYKDDIQVPTILKVQENKSFLMYLKTPSIARLIKKIVVSKDISYSKLYISSQQVLTLKQVYEISKMLKYQGSSWKYYNLKSICKMVIGTAKSMGLNIVNK